MSLSSTVQLCAVLVIAINSPAIHAQTAVSEFSMAMSDAQLEQTPGAIGDCESDSLFAGDAELSLARLVEEVQARNPSVQAMVAAWRSAAHRYPQAVALEDPMFMAMTAPASFGSRDVESAYVLHRRLADLNRAVGGIIQSTTSKEEVPLPKMPQSDGASRQYTGKDADIETFPFKTFAR
jgi:hypothetical protein